MIKINYFLLKVAISILLIVCCKQQKVNGDIVTQILCFFGWCPAPAPTPVVTPMPTPFPSTPPTPRL